MADPAKVNDQNILPVQALFNLDNSFNTFIGQGQPFYATVNPQQSGLQITNSTIDSTTIGATTPSTGVFTNIATTTGTIATSPSGNTDIVNKAYVDAVAQGLNPKQAVKCATTGAITLSGLQTIDTYSVQSGDRVLVKNQGTSSENGIYVASTSGWTRASDMDVWAEVPGAYTVVAFGSVNANTAWVCTASDTGTIGVTAMPWVQFSGVTTYYAGTGLTLASNTFSITNTGVTAGSYGSASQSLTAAVNAQGQLTSLSAQSIAIAANQITSGTIDTARISGSYTGITGVGTLTAGTWNASTIGVAYGGTGATTLTGYVKGNGTAAFTASTTIPNTDITGLGTMSTQNANNVAITGGSATLGTLTTSSLTGYLYGNGSSAVTASTTIPNTAITGLGTMSTQNANAVAITGGTITGLTNLGTDYVQFNTGATVTPAVGKIWWDGGTTVNMGMTTNVVGRLAESLFTYIKASAAITKGEVVVQDGAVGASGVLKAKPAPLNTSNSVTILGIAAEDIALNSFGLIQTHGYLTGLNTTGSSVGETWVDGDLLYYNPAYVGGLTKVKPTAPSIKLPMCEVVNAGSGGSGSLYITIGASSVLGGTDSNVQFGTFSNGDLIQYDSTAQYWKNVATSTISVGTASNLAGGGAGYVPYQSGAGATSFVAAGTSGQVLTSNGSSAPTWTTPTAYATVTDDTTTNATRYPLFASVTAGNLTTEYVSSTKLQFNPSTGAFTATSFSGSASGLTSIPAGQLTGTIPSTVLGNSTLYIGTTAIALNRASASQTLTGTSIDGSAASATSATNATNATNTAITDDTSTNATFYPTFVSNSSGNLPQTVSSTKLKYNPSTGALTSSQIIIAP